MQITIELPDDIADRLTREVSDLSQQVLKALAIEGYRAKLLNHDEVVRMLDLSPEEVNALFIRANAPMPSIETTLQQNLETTDRLPSISETLENIRRICEEEDFELETPPRQNRADQFVVDDVSF